MMEYTSEGYAVADAFQKGMAAYQKEPLVLYGTGKNTQAVLNLTKGFSIVGLLDPNLVGKIIYGIPVLTLEEAASCTKRIVIIARSTVIPIIFRRINEFTKEKGISVYNYAGLELKELDDSYDHSDLEYWKHSWQDLKRKIEIYDVISFDIFDTLLGRYVLSPKDLFRLMEQEEIEIPFTKLRCQAERESGYAPTLDKIYDRFRFYGVDDASRHRLRQKEFDWELRLTYPRRRMVEAFQYALSLGKKVVLTSDMYLSRGEIERLLEKHGISGYHSLLVSCEEKAAKCDGKLFEHLLAETSDNKVLHIGDNRFCDVETAKRMGIDAWQIWSAYELFMASSLWPLLSDERLGIGDRLSLGILCAVLFEDPFALHETKGKVVLNHLKQLSYFIGPWVLSFIQWASKKLGEAGIEQFIYPSRDGFLFYQVSHILQKAGLLQGIDLVYAKASRRAVSTSSALEQKNYREYMKKIGLCHERPTAIFDFVARGTVQYHIEHLLGKRLLGLYFATVEHPNDMFPMEGHVLSAFGNITSYRGGGQLGRIYLALETILTDGDPMLVCINEQGDTVFESDAVYPDKQVLRLQNSVCKWVVNYIEQFGMHNISLNLADALIGALFSSACDLSQPILDIFSHDEISKEEIQAIWYRSY